LRFQVDSDELGELRQKVADAEIGALAQPQAECCYARSDKYWITGPQGIAWETYHTLGEVEIYGTDMPKGPEAAEPGACCAPKPKAVNMTLKRTSCC